MDLKNIDDESLVQTHTCTSRPAICLHISHYHLCFLHNEACLLKRTGIAPVLIYFASSLSISTTKTKKNVFKGRIPYLVRNAKRDRSTDRTSRGRPLCMPRWSDRCFQPPSPSPSPSLPSLLFALHPLYTPLHKRLVSKLPHCFPALRLFGCCDAADAS